MTIAPEIIKKIGRTWPLTFVRLLPRRNPRNSTALATLFTCGTYTELQELQVAFSFDVATADAVKPGALPKLEKLYLPNWDPVSNGSDARRFAAAFTKLPGLKVCTISTLLYKV